MIFGVLLAAVALVITLYNFWDNTRAGSEADELLDEIARVRELSQNNSNEENSSDLYTDKDGDTLDYIKNPETQMPVVNIDGYDYIGTLNIPAINLELPVMKDWDYTRLRISPCHYSGSVYLNNMVIAGHNYRSHFGPIGNLKKGDEVIFTDMKNNVFRYRVAEVDTLEKTAVEEMTSGGWDLTMFNCPLSGNARVTVRCNLME